MTALTQRDAALQRSSKVKQQHLFATGQGHGAAEPVLIHRRGTLRTVTNSSARQDEGMDGPFELLLAQHLNNPQV